MKFNVLICVLFMVLFIPSVQAGERVVNGGFETGDFSGWTNTNMMFQPWYPIFGSHSADWYDTTGNVVQVMDLTDVSTLTFYNNIIQMSPPRPDIKVYIDGDLIYTQNLNDVKVWQHNVDVSAYSGDHSVKIECVRHTTMWINLDGITAISTKNKIYGYVTSSVGGAVISAAPITLNNSGGSTTSNDTGYYEITGITSGTYTITATSPTHEDFSDTVSITSDTEKNITMTRLLPLLTWTDKETTKNDVYLKWRRNMVVDTIKIYKDTDSNLHTTAAAGSYLTGLYEDSNLACDKGIVYWLQPMDGSVAGSKYRIDTKTLPCDGGGGGSVVPDPTPGPTLPPPGPTPPPYTNITPEEWLNMTLEDKQELLINLTAELPPIIPGAWVELTWGDLWRWLLLLLILLCAAVSIDSVTTQKMTKHTGIIMVVPGVYFASLAGYFII